MSDNERWIHCVRRTMRRYAFTWRLYRKDPCNQVEAGQALIEAVRLRDMAHRWRQNSLTI